MPLDPGDYAAIFGAMPTPYLVMSPDIEIIGANSAFLVTVGRTLHELIGQPAFDVFPPSPDALDENGTARIQVVLEQVRDSGSSRVLPLQKYAIKDLDGQTTDRYWSLIAVPVPDAAGQTRLLLLRAEDVTDWVDDRDQGRVSGGGWWRRAEEIEADLYARAQELNAALQAKEQAADRLASLGQVALALTGVDTVEQLEATVVGQGLQVLGADGGAVISQHEDGDWRITLNSALGQKAQDQYGRLPQDSELPLIRVARTGERLLLPDRAAGLACHDSMKQFYVDTLREAWAILPLQLRGESFGSLAVAWATPRWLSAEELDVLEGFAAQCAQALDRIRTMAAQRAAMRQVERMSEALQVSLLTSPPAPPQFDIAARYLPAMQQAQIGGDWYDAFVDSSGATHVSVGDVAGHDRSSAATMAQVRSLLRGLAVDSDDGPGALLGRLDKALETLELDLLATALLARIEHGVLRWSSAGHLPPVICRPDGSVAVLQGESDLLLGLDPHTPRAEHLVELPPGSTLLLYTDGLVERREENLDQGLARLAAAAAECCGRDADEFCDVILAAMLPTEPEDDVAVLVVRVR